MKYGEGYNVIFIFIYLPPLQGYAISILCIMEHGLIQSDRDPAVVLASTEVVASVRVYAHI